MLHSRSPHPFFRDVLIWLVVMGALVAEPLAAQELQPPAWAIGDWWVLNCQVYEAGAIVPGTAGRWLPPQAWRFEVEAQETRGDQSYFVVAIRPQGENPSPYWFRFWFRKSDRYVGRYELHHPQQPDSKHTRNLTAASIRQEFDPAYSVPFLTSKLPALPVTLPVFAEVRQPASRGVQARGARAAPSPYIGSEFELSQEIQAADAQTVNAKTSGDIELLGSGPADALMAVTIRTAAGMREEQYWSADFPWCLYGRRIEHGTETRRYWLIEIGRQ